MRIPKISRLHMTTLAFGAAMVMGLASNQFAHGSNGILRQVHAGGADSCGENPGCDKNYSLSAIVFADGSVNGNLIDRLSGGNGAGFRATIDCVSILDNSPFFGAPIAWVSGTVTQGRSSSGVDLAGQPVWTAVLDVSTSNTSEIPDYIAVTVNDATPCYERPNPLLYGVGALIDGQVTIK